jgi:hypothetical protein
MTSISRVLSPSSFFVLFSRPVWCDLASHLFLLPLSSDITLKIMSEPVWTHVLAWLSLQPLTILPFQPNGPFFWVCPLPVFSTLFRSFLYFSELVVILFQTHSLVAKHLRYKPLNPVVQILDLVLKKKSKNCNKPPKPNSTSTQMCCITSDYLCTTMKPVVWSLLLPIL